MYESIFLVFDIREIETDGGFVHYFKKNISKTELLKYLEFIYPEAKNIDVGTTEEITCLGMYFVYIDGKKIVLYIVESETYERNKNFYNKYEHRANIIKRYTEENGFFLEDCHHV